MLNHIKNVYEEGQNEAKQRQEQIMEILDEV